MNQKQLGIILLIIGLITAMFVYVIKHRENVLVEEIVNEKGTCFLDDGTCLHKTSSSYLIGIGISMALLLMGAYLLFFDKTQETLARHQVKVSTALREAKKQERQKDEFNAYLSGFSEDEQKILSAVKEQDGIKQSTLRYRTGLTKSTISLILKNLEEKEIISRKVSGKTKQVFLQKRF